MGIGPIGLAIQKLRKAAGLNQDDLAQRVGIKLRQMQRIESGASDVNMATIFDLAQALALDSADILEALARAVRKDGLNTDSPAERALSIQSMLKMIWASWGNADPAVKALCLYILTDHGEYISLLTNEQRARVLAAVRALGLTPPKEIS